MLKLPILTILLLSILAIKAQSPIVIKAQANIVLTDQLLNVYLVNNATITKYNSKGIKQFDYSNLILGPITHIDVSDPLRIMIYYNESNTICFLNHQLAEIGNPIDLYSISDTESNIAAASVSGGFWVFDALTINLKYINNNRIIEKESGNLSHELNGKKPFNLIEKNQFIYLQNPEKVLIFDLYGNYIKQILIETLNPVYLTKKQLQYYHNCEIKQLSTSLPAENTIKIDNCTNLINATIIQNKLILHFRDKITINDIIK